MDDSRPESSSHEPFDSTTTPTVPDDPTSTAESSTTLPSDNIPSKSPSNPHSQIEVYTPLQSTSQPTPTELDDTFFEPTLSDVQAHRASVVARSRRLNEAPLVTSKIRDEERDVRERRKEEKWPSTTIRVRFSDGTMVQSVFPSISPIQPVYAFVRSTLDASASTKPFVLWQPPRTQYPEHPLPQPNTTLSKKQNHLPKTQIITPATHGFIKGGVVKGLQGGTGGKESLNELGLVPQSVLLVRWEDEEMNGSEYPAPLTDELKAKSVPLPAAVVKDPPADERKTIEPPKPGEKKIPKWLQKGLMKRK